MRPALALALALATPLAARATPAPTPTLVEQWRFVQPGLTVRAVLPRPDGGLWVAGEFDAPIDVGGRVLTPRGGTDVALLVLRIDGRLRAAHTLGGPADERAYGLVVAEQRAQLLASTRGSLDVGGRTVKAPAGEAGSLPGVSALVVTLGPEGAPERIRLALPGAERPALAAQPDGFAIAYDHDRGFDGPRRCTVARYVGEAATWSRTLQDLDVMRLDALRGALYLSVGGKRRLEVHPLDPQTGADSGPLTGLSTPASGDRGAITALVEGPVGPRVVGYSGREPVRQPDGERASHAIEPFALQLGRPEKARRSIVDAVASVAAVGRLGDELATVVDVIHPGPRYGGTSPETPGAWLTIGLGGPLRLVPIHLRGDGAPKTTIGPIWPSRGSQVTEGHITLIGRCDPQGEVGCVVRLRVK